MAKIYSENERSIMYDFFVKRTDLSVAQICEEIKQFNMQIKPKTFAWLMQSWDWIILRRLSKYQNIFYSYHERSKAQMLPEKILSKVSDEAIKKINKQKKSNRDNRKWRDKIKNGEVVETVEVIDITDGVNTDLKVISTVVENKNKTDNKTGNKTTNLPYISGLTDSIISNRQHSFTVAEEESYQLLKKRMFEYDKLNLSTERLMREIIIGDSGETVASAIYFPVMQRLEDECILRDRIWLISKRAEDLAIEQADQVRTNEVMKYAYVNQGLRDEFAYDQGRVRQVIFKDIETGAPSVGMVHPDDDDANKTNIGGLISSRPARLTTKHINVMSTLKNVIQATQINIGNSKEMKTVISNTNTPIKSIEQLEKENLEAQKLVEILKQATVKIDTSPSDNCNKECQQCHKKLICNDSILKEGMYNNE